MREAGLQFASFPFDWVGSPGLMASVRMLETDFSGWLEKEDLELYDVRRAPLFSQVYRNSRTGFGFPHDFPISGGKEESYAAVRERYDRRIRRLMKTIGASRRVLAVYIERMIDPRLTDVELVEARQIMASRFPGACIELLYFHQEDECKSPREDIVADGVRAIALDYKIVAQGIVMHEVNREPITDCLKRLVSVVDSRSTADIRRHQDIRRQMRERRWGKMSLLRRLMNEIAYKWYRRLERRLSDRGVIPREGPLWF